jgi:hypothetical protein
VVLIIGKSYIDYDWYMPLSFIGSVLMIYKSLGDKGKKVSH